MYERSGQVSLPLKTVHAELAKDLDFDFDAGVFQNLLGLFSIEIALDIYQIWEGNFLHYWQELNAFTVQITYD
nr:DUF2787 family protein [Alteromonas sp. B31-7]